MSISDVAHLLRRATFGPTEVQLAKWSRAPVASVIDQLFEAPPIVLGPPPALANDKDPYDPPAWWLHHIGTRETGLHEKLVWFWHGHFATSNAKVGNWDLMWQQHLLLRQHALGNFRGLLHAVTIDPAMLVYLDGDNSVAEHPNENYGREVMELFALGRDHYSQLDVHAAALALAGWTVDRDHKTSALKAEGTYPRPVRFLDRHARMNAADVVDAICDHPACAPFVASRLYRFLCGHDPAPQLQTQLGDLFRKHDLDIAPVVEAILRDPSFLASKGQRPRPPVEWTTAAIRALGLADDGDPDKGASPRRRVEWCTQLGQVPFQPPNVAGWPDGARWLGAGVARQRSRLALEAQPVAEIIHAEDPVSAVLRRCCLFDVSEPTRAALSKIVEQIQDFSVQSRVLLAATVASPEFAMS